MRPGPVERAVEQIESDYGTPTAVMDPVDVLLRRMEAVSMRLLDAKRAGQEAFAADLYLQLEHLAAGLPGGGVRE